MGSVKTMMGSGLSGNAAVAIGAGTFAGGLSAAGSTNADAFQMTADFNVFTTVGSGQGARLPDVEVGSDVTVVNGGANALLVYPTVGAQLNNQTATTAGRTIGAGKAGVLRRGAFDQWALIGDTA